MPEAEAFCFTVEILIAIMDPKLKENIEINEIE